MAIISEIIEDGRIRHYSDKNLKMRQIETGAIYEDAVDVVPCRYTYEETDVPIEDIELQDSEVLDILLGDDNNGQTD